MWPRPRFTSIPSAVLIHPAVWSQQTWAEIGWLCPPLFFGGGAGSPSSTMWPGSEAHLRAKCHLDPSSRLATIDMSRTLWALSSFWRGELGFHLTQSRLAEAYLHTKWHLPSSHLATTDMSRKLGAVPLWGGAAGSPSNTIWTGPMTTSVSSFILIHPTV